MGAKTLGTNCHQGKAEEPGTESHHQPYVDSFSNGMTPGLIFQLMPNSEGACFFLGSPVLNTGPKPLIWISLEGRAGSSGHCYIGASGPFLSQDPEAI